MLKVGLVVPQSSFLPKVSREFRDAFRAGLASTSSHVDVVLQVGGFLNRERDVANMLHKLVLEDDVDVIVTPLNPNSLSALRSIVDAEQIPLVVCSMGENLLPVEAESEYIHINSFDMWTSGWLLGEFGIRQFGPRSIMACAFQDGAYGFFAAVEKGAVSAGGQVVNSIVSRRWKNRDDAFVDIAKLEAEQADVLFACYSGADAIEFYEVATRTKGVSQTPVLSLPFGLEADVLGELADFETPISTISTIPGANPHSSPYTLIAFETGGLIGAADALMEAEGINLNDALEKCRITGPRGTIGLCHTGIQQPGVRYYLNTVKQSGAAMTMEKEIAVPSDCLRDRENGRSPKDFRGWINPYLLA